MTRPRRSAGIRAAWLASYRPNTAAAYGRDLGGFTAWLGRDPLTVTRSEVQAWANRLGEVGWRPATIRRKVSAVSSFLNYAAQEGAVRVNAAAHVRRPLGGDLTKLGLAPEQARALIGVARIRGPAAEALIGLLMVSGLRVSEACGATAEAIAEDYGRPALVVTRKGGRSARIPLPADVLDALRRTLADRIEGPIFKGPRGGFLDRHRAALIVAELGEAAGIDALTPHLLRHTAATTALRAGVPLEKVQALLGHRSPATTMRYAQALRNLEADAADRLAATLYH